MTSHRFLYAGVAVMVLLVVGVAAGLYLTTPSTTNSNSGKLIQVVAAENFWGSLASQLGGTRVNVTSVLSDPNTDPHEYQSNPATARAISNAQLVIVNGAGYDTWALDIIAASKTPNQKVLNVQELTGQAVNDNPHLWYSPAFVNDTVKAVYKYLIATDPADTTYFHQQYTTLNASLWQSYMKGVAQIKAQFPGAPIAGTEDIFVYLADAAGLKVASPPGFMQAVAEGNDPSPQDLAAFQQLLKGGKSSVRALLYNVQTESPVTQSIKALAVQNGVPIVGITETVQPPNEVFQSWMGGEVTSLLNALKS